MVHSTSFKDSQRKKHSLSIRRFSLWISLISANKREIVFFWLTASCHESILYCVTQERMRLHRRGQPKVSLKPKGFRFFRCKMTKEVVQYHCFFISLFVVFFMPGSVNVLESFLFTGRSCWLIPLRTRRDAQPSVRWSRTSSHGSGVQGTATSLVGGTHLARYFPIVGTHRARHFLIGGSRRARYFLIRGSRRTRYFPIGDTHRARYFPIGGTHCARYFPIEGAHSTRYFPIGGTHRTRYFPPGVRTLPGTF